KGDERKRLTELQDQIGRRFMEIQKIDTRVLEISREWNTQNLDSIYEKKFEAANQMGERVMQAEIALEHAKAREGATDAVLNWSADRIANFSPRLAAKLSERDNLEYQMSNLKLRGFMKENQQVKDLEAMIERKNTEIDRI